jgi:soluble lytic murein transglycosylase-like protein
LAVIQIESAFNPYAVSRVGAQGMMQVMPFWKKEIGRPEDNLIDLETNLRYGSIILKHYLDREKGHFANALARYNGSYGSYKYSRKVMDAWLDYWR